MSDVKLEWKVKELWLLDILDQEVCHDRRNDLGQVMFFFLQIGTIKSCLHADGNGFRMVQEIKGIIAGQLPLNTQEEWIRMNPRVYSSVEAKEREEVRYMRTLAVRWMNL